MNKYFWCVIVSYRTCPRQLQARNDVQNGRKHHEWHARHDHAKRQQTQPFGTVVVQTRLRAHTTHVCANTHAVLRMNARTHTHINPPTLANVWVTSSAPRLRLCTEQIPSPVCRTIALPFYVGEALC